MTILPRLGASSRTFRSATRSVGTWSGCSMSGSAGVLRASRLPATDDLEAPRFARSEQRIRIDVAEPPDEVLLGLDLRGAVDSGAAGVELQVEIVTAALEGGEALLDRRAFRVSLPH
jgi:hypothetical protein